MAETEELLTSIPQWVKDRDVNALAGLRDHPDKQVRKAVRKAIHSLKSRGVEVPETAPKAWSTGDALQSLRGDLTPIAIIDTTSAPGAVRFTISEPETSEGARLFAGTIGPDDRVVDFQAYLQTDGQRARTVRDWKRRIDERSVDIPWLKSRIRWAREQTLAAGYQVPRHLEEVLAEMGEPPSERPRSFLGPELAKHADLVAEEVGSDGLMDAIGLPMWPPMLQLDSMLEKAASIHGDKPQPTEESERLALLAQSMEGDPSVREGLRDVIPNVLDDCAIDAWLEGNPARAKAAFDMAAELRNSTEPEKVSWAPRLVGYQVASLLRMVGGPEAVRKAMAEEQARLAAEQQGQSADE